MRLIDADALMKVIKKEHDCIMQNPNVGYQMKWREAVCFRRSWHAIENAPTANAVEVVHAYWVGDEPGDWHCSHCGEYAADGGYEQTRYCPNCGADMRERNHNA